MLCAAYSGEDGGALKEAEVLKKASDVGVEAPEADVFFLCLGRNFSLEGTPGRIVTEKSPAARSTHRTSFVKIKPVSHLQGASQHVSGHGCWAASALASIMVPALREFLSVTELRRSELAVHAWRGLGLPDLVLINVCVAREDVGR